jgi:hypothetical protein
MWGISWVNLLMLLATIPVYKSKTEKEKDDKVVDGFDELSDLDRIING